MAKHNLICAVDGCGKKSYLRGWCSAHYQRWRRYGSPTGGGTMEGEPERFLRESVLAYAGDECLTWPFATVKGYGVIKRDGVSTGVHRIVCEHVHGPAPTKRHEAAHSCGNGVRGCVTPGHLRWASKLENNRDMILHGTMPRGESSGRTTLTEDDVREIRRLSGSMMNKDIAAMFSVSPEAISGILNRRNWAWLE